MRHTLYGVSIFFVSLSPNYGWGHESHRLVGYIAASLLDDADKTDLQKIMGWTEDVARISDQVASHSTYADEIANSAGTFDFHTANYQIDPTDQSIKLKCFSNVCLWTGMSKWTASAIDPASTTFSVRHSFKHIFHLIADAFQPLHVGRRSDWGGSLIKNVFKPFVWKDHAEWGMKQTLHKVWDSGLYFYEEIHFRSPGRTEDEVIDGWKSGYTGSWQDAAVALQAELNDAGNAHLRTCLEGGAPRLNARDPQAIEDYIKDIALETARLAKEVAYVEMDGTAICSNTQLTDQYMDNGIVVMKEQLMRASAQLACYLRDVLAAYRDIRTTATTTTTPAPILKKKTTMKVVKKVAKAAPKVQEQSIEAELQARAKNRT